MCICCIGYSNGKERNLFGIIGNGNVTPHSTISERVEIKLGEHWNCHEGMGIQGIADGFKTKPSLFEVGSQELQIIARRSTKSF